jgi:hypothetical protein
VEPAYTKIIGGVCGNNRFHKSGDIILYVVELKIHQIREHIYLLLIDFIKYGRIPDCQRACNQVEPAYTKIIGGVCGNNRFHKSGDIILTLNMVKSHFSFISYTDNVQVFQKF